MQIFIKLVGDFAQLSGKKEDIFEVSHGIDVEKALQLITQKYGEPFSDAIVDLKTGQYRPYITLVLLVNGRNINLLNGLKTELKNGDTLMFIPPVMGG